MRQKMCGAQLPREEYERLAGVPVMGIVRTRLARVEQRLRSGVNSDRRAQHFKEGPHPGGMSRPGGGSDEIAVDTRVVEAG